MTITAGVRVDPATRMKVPSPARTGRTDAWSGAAAMLPLLASYAPFGCLVGVAVAHSSAPIAGWTGAWLIFGGTADLIALQLTATGSSVLVATLSALAVNVRLVLYSATIGPHWRGTPLSRWAPTTSSRFRNVGTRGGRTTCPASAACWLSKTYRRTTCP